MVRKNFMRAIALSGAMSLMLSSAAFADVSISNTGPNSNNQVTQNNTNTSHVDNDNNVKVINKNDQDATSGSAKVKGNTTGGNATSGNATNNNTTTTRVAIGNNGANVSAGSGSGGGQGSGAGAGSSSASPSSAGKGGGLASAGKGGAVLPGVGCSVVCDVSALRAGFHPSDVTNAAQQTKGVSAGLLALAALLSLVGAGGSAVYATRRANA